MALKDALIAELKHESSMTKKILERVPIEKASWKPHDKSYTLGRLATHIAETPHWISRIANMEEFDFVKQGFSSYTAASHDELMHIFQEKLDYAIADLEKMSDDDFRKTWVVRRGEHIISELRKDVAIRGWGFSHLIHHRGQLSVYLRLLDIPVPGMYGPSADER